MEPSATTRWSYGKRDDAHLSRATRRRSAAGSRWTSTSPTKTVACRSSVRSGLTDVRDVEVARCDLVEHRRKEKEVLAADERDVRGIRQEAARDAAPCIRRQSRRQVPRCEFEPCRVASADWMSTPPKRYSSLEHVAVRNLLTESAIQQVDHEAFGSALAGISD